MPSRADALRSALGNSDQRPTPPVPLPTDGTGGRFSLQGSAQAQFRLLLAVLQGADAHHLPEDAAEVGRRWQSRSARPLALMDSSVVSSSFCAASMRRLLQVVHDGLPRHPPEQAAEVVGRKVEPRRHLGEGELLPVVGGKVGADLLHGLVAGARCGAALGKALLLHIVQDAAAGTARRGSPAPAWRCASSPAGCAGGGSTAPGRTAPLPRRARTAGQNPAGWRCVSSVQRRRAGTGSPPAPGHGCTGCRKHCRPPAPSSSALPGFSSRLFSPICRVQLPSLTSRKVHVSSSAVSSSLLPFSRTVSAFTFAWIFSRSAFILRILSGDSPPVPESAFPHDTTSAPWGQDKLTGGYFA